MVLMMKPKVGLTLFTSSSIIFLTIVVFPALSNPLPGCQKKPHQWVSATHSIRILISLSFRRAFRSIDSIFENRLSLSVEPGVKAHKQKKLSDMGQITWSKVRSGTMFSCCNHEFGCHADSSTAAGISCRLHLKSSCEDRITCLVGKLWDVRSGPCLSKTHALVVWCVKDYGFQLPSPRAVHQCARGRHASQSALCDPATT